MAICSAELPTGRPAQGLRHMCSVLKPNQDHQSMRREFSNYNIKHFPNQRLTYQWKTIALLYFLLVTLWLHIIFMFNYMEGVGGKESYRHRHYNLFTTLNVLFWPWLSWLQEDRNLLALLAFFRIRQKYLFWMFRIFRWASQLVWRKKIFGFNLNTDTQRGLFLYLFSSFYF